ncbi:MAG: hypothetical protein RLZZ400_994 [Actinomycetota bacterium]
MPEIALATRHGKERQIAPALAAIGWQVVVSDIDTDAFGTFSGDVARVLTPKQTALAKARAGAEHLGVRYGMASEGSIGSHPSLPFVTSDFEILAFADTQLDLTWAETFLGSEIVAVSEKWSQELDLDAFAKRADLPNHAVIVRNGDNHIVWVKKGLRDVEEIVAAAEECAAHHETVVLESDFRAMCSPSRQRNIEACAEKFALRLARLCESCGYPGWGITGLEFGLPCSDCGELVADVANAELHGCLACSRAEKVPLGKTAVGPERCHSCNP